MCGLDVVVAAVVYVVDKGRMSMTSRIEALGGQAMSDRAHRTTIARSGGEDGHERVRNAVVHV